MSQIGPARPGADQLAPTNYNGTPGCYALPKGQTMGSTKNNIVTEPRDKVAIKTNRGKHPAQQAALEAKHGTYLKLQKDAAERKKQMLAERVAGAKKGEALTVFEKESKEHREVRM
jgi:hypothetical protein